ncbi:MAG TPA: ABC transporter permease [Candidatus Sulfopaludibacter sp.]|jgi:predicted permease|nr:ABC transporter permease [Candidatus Sulfopaludibacter sp.]
MAWLARIRNVLRSGRLESDIDRELHFHVDERADELQAGGMSRPDALRTARLQFGNHTSQVERTRDMDIHTGLEALARNLRLALRSLAKTPAFTATVIVTLALGIGANSAVFSAIDAVLLKPLPFPHGDQLMRLSEVDAHASLTMVAPARLEDWNRLADSFQAISGYYSQDDSELSGELPEKLSRALVAPRFLRVLGVSPALGRDFTPEEERFNGPDAVLISDRFWRHRFGASPSVIGKTLRFGRSAVPIIGVMPPSFRFPDGQVDLWSVSPPDGPYAQSRDVTWFTVIGRLKPGISLSQARANLAAVQADLGRQFPKSDKDLRTNVEPLKEITVGGSRQSLMILYGSVSLLLLIACINIAALLLSRATARRHEVAVRYSLGASRASVIYQFLTEVLLLSLAGSVLGLFVAAGAASVFRVLAHGLPRLEEIGLDWRIVCYSLACAVAATLVCGLLPALRGTRRSLALSMAHAGRSHVGGRNPIQFLLVSMQVAIAVTLLAGAGLLLRSLHALGEVSPGFEAGHVLSFQMSMSWGETADQKAARQRTARILEQLRSIPGVESAASSMSLPGVPNTFQVELKSLEGRADTAPKMLAQARVVSPEYFATMHIPLMAGDVCHDGQPATAMVNRSFADRYFSGASAIGHTLVQPGSIYVQASKVSGIVGDAHEMGIDQPPFPAIYWCYSAAQPGMYFLARTHGDPISMVETIRRKLREVEPRRSVYDIAPVAEKISDGYAENRMRTILLAFFAATAVLLACVGLYGTLSYLVNVRQREVGLRLALGALRGQIIRQFLAQGLRVSLLGCAAGLLLALASTRLLAGMLYGVSPSDTTTLTAVIAIVVAVSVLASLLPALRASRLEPMQVLRDE